MSKIIFTNTNCSWNKGSAAQVISTAKIFRELIPDIDLTLISHHPQLDSKYCNDHNINISTSFWWRIPEMRILGYLYFVFFPPIINLSWAFLFRIGLNPNKIKSSVIKEYLSADAIIDLSGDSFGNKAGSPIYIASTIIFAIALKKPIVLFSQSIGPFNWYSISLVKYCLNKVNLIIIRENITKNYLNDLGIKSPIILSADCAFVLDPISNKKLKDILSKEGIDISRPVVGISANALYETMNYKNSLAKAIDHMVEKYNSQIIFIPHVVSIIKDSNGDDRTIAREIYDLAKNKDNIKLIETEYSPSELKAIIKTFDFFIGGRMHANIAALSSNVPTIAISWSHKYKGIMSTLGQEKFVFDFNKMDFNDLKSKIDELWINKEKIQKDLKIKSKEQQLLVWESAKLVKEILEE